MTELEPARGAVVGPGRAAPDVLGRLLTVAGAIRRATLKLAFLAAAAAVVLGYALLRHGLPGATGRAVLTVVGVVAVALPPVVLAAFWVALGELLELPERVRRLPAETREHGEQLRQLAQDARARRRGWLGVPGHLWRLTRLTASSREVLTPYAPLLPLLSPPFLLAVALSAGAAAAELIAALVVLLVLLFG